MSINYFRGNQYVSGKFQRAIRKIGFWTKRAILVSGAITALGWLVFGGISYGRLTAEPQVVNAKEIVEVPVETDSPVLNRIAKCESGGAHYKNGQVIFNANTNKTVDIGYYQINSIWNKKASELGLDLTKEADNKAFGVWLYKNYGTEPWVYTKDCWNK